nr:hypothetical protein CFP56_73765 [Quercus suber]
MTFGERGIVSFSFWSCPAGTFHSSDIVCIGKAIDGDKTRPRIVKLGEEMSKGGGGAERRGTGTVKPDVWRRECRVDDEMIDYRSRRESLGWRCVMGEVSSQACHETLKPEA